MTRDRTGKIDITREMIEAGETELAGYGPDGFDSAETVVCAIFSAMVAASGARSTQVATGEKAPLTSGARSRSRRANHPL